jgi:hypothetical protein
VAGTGAEGACIVISIVALRLLTGFDDLEELIRPSVAIVKKSRCPGMRSLSHVLGHTERGLNWANMARRGHRAS